jgi:hypothetical protein
MVEKKYNLRLPAELYNALESRAANNMRSVNNEIVIILQRLVSKQEKIEGIEDAEEIANGGRSTPGHSKAVKEA